MSFESHLDDPLLREVYAYWRQKRAARRMPQRRQIDPADVPRLLPHLSISEVIDAGQRFRYRLVGTAVARALGRDPTGHCIDDTAGADTGDPVGALHRTVCRERVALFATNALAGRTHVQYRVVRRLLLPLSEDDASVHQILSLAVFQFAVGAPMLTVLDVASPSLS
ncbi:MAG TPA: PAS domain-containing protein [Stellaceae bacterium]|jgi:hypothetical protein|nr:PAS domain-containing protein [Stellaceae bacterium]